jgi:uncharacterized membrane protein
MNTQRKILHKLPKAQQGVVTIFAVIMMLSLLAFFAVVTDTGRLYLEKRSLQKNADLAALETALRYCRDQEMDVESLTLSDLQAEGQVFSPERNNFQSTDIDSFLSATLNGNAVTVTLTKKVPASLFGGVWEGLWEQQHPNGVSNPNPISSREINLTARATAKACEPTAQLTIRSTGVVSVDTTGSPLLNPVLGGLLGATINAGVASYEGLLGTNINLLSYFDALATHLGLAAGDYNGVLATEVSVGDLLGIAADVLQNNGKSRVDIDTFLSEANDMSLISSNDGSTIDIDTPILTLGEILSAQPNIDESALDTELQVLQLVQGTVQLANSKSVASADIAIDLPGLVGVSVRLNVIAPPQISAIGNPEEAIADADHLGSEEIYVRTAAIRALVSIDLPILENIALLVNAVTDLATPITNVLDGVLTLNLANAFTSVTCLLGIPCEVVSVKVVPGLSRIDISIDIGASEAYISDYECGASTDKSLTVDGTTSVASLRVGQLDLDEGSPDFVFGSTAPPQADPLPLIDIGLQTCSKLLSLPISCDDRRAFAGGGLGLAVSLDEEDGLISTLFSEEYLNPPLIGEPPLYTSFNGENLVGSLSGALSGIELEAYEPDGGGGLGGVMILVDGTLSLVNGILTPVIDGLLSPLLDPLLNTLLDTLGLSLANTEVGANLSCENDSVRLTN